MPVPTVNTYITAVDVDISHAVFAPVLLDWHPLLALKGFAVVELVNSFLKQHKRRY